MHYLGYLFTKSASPDLVELDMAPFGDGRKWDWYEIGGRWSGHLGGQNARPAKEVTGDSPYFFIHEGQWVEKQSWDASMPNPHGAFRGALRKNEHFEDHFREVLAAHPDLLVVVIDAHI